MRTEYCSVEQTYRGEWSLGDTYDGYGAPTWPDQQTMLSDLRAIIAHFDPADEENDELRRSRT